MKLNGIVYDLPAITAEAKLQIETMGDEHVPGSSETPMREGAFDQSDEEKMDIIARHFAGIMHTLGLDLNDDSLSGTPHRVAKMFVKEVFSGLNPANKPDSKLFDNAYRYGEMLVEKNITLKSYCEHHFVPITGVVHVAYISSGKVIGLSKINRIVQYFGRRPQVQERLNMQIGEELKRMLETEDVAVIVDARHMCVSMRGVQDEASSTTTSFYSGKFRSAQVKEEFHRYIGLC